MSNPQGGKGNSLGLAIGATNLAGTGDGRRPVVRPATVTLDGGHTLTGFVDRVGDPIPMVAQDGSRHRAEMLLAEALDGVARGAAIGAPVSEVAITVPAHWRPPVVDSLRAALRTKPGLSKSPLVSDATAALTALRSNPGLPSTGVIVLCDFGGSGASITLADAAAKDAPIGETVRVPDFSGDHIDQSILTKVVAGIFEASDSDPSSTAMVGSLTRLRDECRRAKERLSAETATSIAVDLPGLETKVRMTRMELDDLIAEPLAEFLAALVDTLDRNRVPLASISAVATVGGGARISLVTQRLSEHLRTKVVTTPLPQLTAAQGAALIAHRSRIVETATTLTPAAGAIVPVAAAASAPGESAAVGALAWSEVEADDSQYPLETQPHFDDHNDARPTDSRPEVHFKHDEWDARETKRRGPVVLFGLSAAAALVAVVVFGLTTFTRDTPTVPAGTSSSIAPSPAPAVAVSPPPAEAPAPATASAPRVTTVVSRTQQRVAPAPQQPAAVQPAPQHPAAPPQQPAAPPPPAPEPATPNPEPADPGTPTDPGTPSDPARHTSDRPRHRRGPDPGTPPIDPGTGGGPGTGTPPIDPGTGGGDTGTGTGTPPIDPGTGGSGTGTGGTAMTPPAAETDTGGTPQTPPAADNRHRKLVRTACVAGFPGKMQL